MASEKVALMKKPLLLAAMCVCLFVALYSWFLTDHTRPLKYLTIVNDSPVTIEVWTDASRPYRWVKPHSVVTPDTKFWHLDDSLLRVDDDTGKEIGKCKVRDLDDGWVIFFPEISDPPKTGSQKGHLGR